MKKKNSILSITVILAILVFALWLLLLIYKYFTTGISADQVIDDIMANLVGMLIPIIIFNFVYEYLTKDKIAEDMSQTITETLMANAQSIATFSQETKEAFVETTVGTIVGDEYKSMAYDVIKPYLKNHFNIRPFFKYNFILREYDICDPIFTKEKYMQVYESLVFKRKYAPGKSLPQKFAIGFFTDAERLDSELRSENYIFSENFKIDSTEMDSLKAFTNEKRLDYIKNNMGVQVFINDNEAQITDINVGDFGMDINFISNHTKNKDDEQLYKVEITFNMPQKKGISEILVSLTEPTFSPLIQLSYPESTMKVKMHSFLNGGDDALVQNAMRSTGVCDICLENTWIYPVSGVIFIIENQD